MLLQAITNQVKQMSMTNLVLEATLISCQSCALTGKVQLNSDLMQVSDKSQLGN